MANKLEIPSKANIRVYWDDKPENYSREERNKVRNYFSKKYNIDKGSINVIFRPVKTDTNGNTVPLTGVGIENVMDINYQHQLFKEWLKREEKVVDFNRLLALDKKVNDMIDFKEEEFNYRTWSLKYLVINNFLSFGEDNKIHYSKLKGINIVTSEPKNMGGKCVRSDTKVVIKFDESEIIKNLGFIPDELK
jgi:hypothetical protein